MSARLSLLHLQAPTVSQAELETVLGIESQIRQLRQLHAEYCAAILDRLVAGDAIEPGRHSACLQESTRGCRRITRLVIDGRRTLP